MKLAVVGANGQLGTDLVEILSAAGHRVAGLTHEDLRVEERDSVAAALRPLGPDAVLNTAAFHVVPRCETEPEQAYRVNALGALHVTQVCHEMGARHVYFSTDYVFDGAKGSPYVESDLPAPLNVYAVTKLAGEHFTLAYSDRSLVVRVSGIYGKVPSRAKGGNFVTTMLRLAREKPEVRVVQDEVLTPTSTEAIARAVAGLLETDERGCFHMTCEGQCSWYEFARAIFDRMSLATPLHPTSAADMPSPVRRPFYSVLENARMKQAGLPTMPHWREALDRYLRRRRAD